MQKKLLLIIFSCFYMCGAIKSTSPKYLKDTSKAKKIFEEFKIDPNNTQEISELISKFTKYKNKEITLAKAERLQLFTTVWQLKHNPQCPQAIKENIENLLDISESTIAVEHTGEVCDMPYKEANAIFDLWIAHACDFPDNQFRLVHTMLHNIDPRLINADHSFRFNLSAVIVNGTQKRIMEAQALNQLDQNDIYLQEQTRTLAARIITLEFPQKIFLLLVRSYIDHEWAY